MHNILVVDDTPDNLRLLGAMLTEHQYEVRLASEGAFALQSARETPPDLILLDIKMPGMDGHSVCQALKADTRTRDIPVIFISALSDLTNKVKGFEVGGVDYITKPFQTDEVLVRVKTHLTLQALRQELQTQNAHLQHEIAARAMAEEELQTLNRQLQESNQQLGEANACKDKFFSIIAHDLRGPFTGLIGLTEALEENLKQYTPDELKRFLHQMHISTTKTYTLLTNLLEWSRLERGLNEPDPKDIALTLLIQHGVGQLTANAAQKQITLRNLVTEDFVVCVDVEMINTVIRNLISNALKFTAPGGSVEVAARHHEHGVELCVSDTGIGMTPEGMQKLFRLDAKYTRTGTANEEGTGLGLILCKELVEKNGGAIRVESEVGQGTTCIVTLPCRAL